MSPFHFESVTLCVCARNNLTSNCEQKRTLHFSMTVNFFSMTRNFFASPGNFFAFDSLHFWMTKCTERRLLLLRGSAKRDRPYAVSMRTFCESESGGWKEREARPWRCGGFTPLVLSPLGLPVLFPRRRHLFQQ